jgi:hypothetical protein
VFALLLLPLATGLCLHLGLVAPVRAALGETAPAIWTQTSTSVCFHCCAFLHLIIHHACIQSHATDVVQCGVRLLLLLHQTWSFGFIILKFSLRLLASGMLADDQQTPFVRNLRQV